MTAKNNEQEISNKELKSCFIITPIGQDGSDIRRRTEGIIETVLKPVLADRGFKPTVAHQVYTPGSITRQIITSILEDELVIADISDLNPNVMYELAVRHCAAKPVIIIAEDNTSLPFDIGGQRTIFYTNDALGVSQLKVTLEKYIKEMLTGNSEELNSDNPVYEVVQKNLFDQAVIKESKNPDVTGEMIKRFDSLEESIVKVMHEVTNLKKAGPKAIKGVGLDTTIGGMPNRARVLNNLILGSLKDA